MGGGGNVGKRPAPVLQHDIPLRGHAELCWGLLSPLSLFLWSRQVLGQEGGAPWRPSPGVGQGPFRAGTKRQLCLCDTSRGWSCSPPANTPSGVWRTESTGSPRVLFWTPRCPLPSYCGGAQVPLWPLAGLHWRHAPWEVTPSHPRVSLLQNALPAGRTHVPSGQGPFWFRFNPTGASLFLPGPQGVKWGRWSLGSTGQSWPTSPFVPKPKADVPARLGACREPDTTGARDTFRGHFVTGSGGVRSRTLPGTYVPRRPCEWRKPNPSQELSGDPGTSSAAGAPPHG